MENVKEKLSIDILKKEAICFCKYFTSKSHNNLFRVNDGKSIGNYIESEFKKYLFSKYDFVYGNSAYGIDFPSQSILTDLKVTSSSKPQSSCPFKSARQKIYGLGYNILLFIYDKIDINSTAIIQFTNCIFIPSEYTSDYNITKHLNFMLDNKSNVDDIIYYLKQINLPALDNEIESIAKEILLNRPKQGYLTISNALQYRLHYPYLLSNDLVRSDILNYEFK